MTTIISSIAPFSAAVESMRSGVCILNSRKMAGLLLLHSWSMEPRSLPLLGFITVATPGTAVLPGLAIGGFVLRQSRPYLLLVAAVGALLGRSVGAGFSITGSLSTTHHLFEHGMDVILVALSIAVVYHSRTVSREAEFNP